MLLIVNPMITNGKKQPFHSNAVVFNKADRSLQHKAVRLFIFKVLLDFCFHFFLRVQRPAKTSQPQNRVFSDELQKHDYLHFKKKRRSLSFYSGAAKKKKKRFPHSFISLVPAPLLRSTSVPR